jgi:hypothetical protein
MTLKTLLGYFLAVFSACILSGCATPKTIPSAYISDPSFYFTSPHAPSAAEFNSAVDQAVAGDDEQLLYILRLIRFTEGSSGRSFGGTLNRLEQLTGPERFNAAKAALSPDEAAKVKSAMATAAAVEASIIAHGGKLE